MHHMTLPTGILGFCLQHDIGSKSNYDFEPMFTTSDGRSMFKVVLLVFASPGNRYHGNIGG